MKTMKRALLGMALVFMMAAAGVIPVYAASSYSDPVTVSIQYTQIYDADSSHAVDSFRYSVTPMDGAPAPADSENGVYYFSMKCRPKSARTTGTEEMKVQFTAPGEYTYEIRSNEEKTVKNIKYDTTVYTAHVYVKNAASGGLRADVTITDDKSDKKYDAVSFEHSYKKDDDDEEHPITTPEDDDHEDDDDQDDQRPRPATPADDNDGGGAGTIGGGPGDNGPAEEDEEDDDETIVERIQNAIPKADPDRDYWTLLNLISALVTVILALIMLFRFLQRIDTDEDEYVIRRGGKLRLVGIPPAVISVIVFILTEDISLPDMKLMDEWTPFMMIMLLISMFVAALVYKKYDAKDNDEQTSAPA